MFGNAEKVRSQVQASKMRFLREIKGVTMFDNFVTLQFENLQHRVAAFSDRKISA